MSREGLIWTLRTALKSVPLQEIGARNSVNWVMMAKEDLQPKLKAIANNSGCSCAELGSECPSCEVDV